MRFKLMATLLLVALLSTTGFACDKDNDGRRSCSSVITACGCTITKDGTYIVANDLNADSGLTTNNACIDVASDGVVLLTNGHTITGEGAGIGINLLPEAKGAFLSAAGSGLTYTSVSGWQYGMKVTADDVTSEGFYFTKNTTGVFMSHVRHNNLSLFGSYDNAEYGVLAEHSIDNRFEFGGVWGNRTVGLYLADDSDRNFVFEVYVAYTPYYGCGIWSSGYGVQNYGFYVKRGSTGNTFVDNAAFHDTVADLFDDNERGKNLWHANQFGTAGQGFIQ